MVGSCYGETHRGHCYCPTAFAEPGQDQILAHQSGKRGESDIDKGSESLTCVVGQKAQGKRPRAGHVFACAPASHDRGHLKHPLSDLKVLMDKDRMETRGMLSGRVKP